MDGHPTERQISKSLRLSLSAPKRYSPSVVLGLEKRIIRWPEVQIGNSGFNLNLS
jgi:hypothetical protein